MRECVSGIDGHLLKGMTMRSARLRVLTVLWMMAGCAPDRAADPEAVATREVVPATDSVVTPAATTDTVQVARKPWEEPGDCRYADERPRVPRDDPRYGERYDSAAIAGGVTYRCTLRPDGPQVRLVVLGEWSIPMAVKVFLPPDADSAVQMLTLDNDQGAYEGGDLLKGEDLNGDGWMDLYVYTWSGTAGQMSDVFRFDPAARRFVPDALPGMNVHRLEERGCVGTSTKSSAWDHSGADYCWRDGRWVKIRTIEQRGFRHETDSVIRGVVRTEHRLRDGQLRLFRLDTLLEQQ